MTERIKALEMEYITSRGLWCIDRDPKDVSHDWIKENAFQLDENPACTGGSTPLPRDQSGVAKHTTPIRHASIWKAVICRAVDYLAAQNLLAVKGKPEISDEGGDLHIAYMVGFEKGRESAKGKAQDEECKNPKS